MITHSVQEFNQYLIANMPLIGIDYGLKKLGLAVSSHNLKMSLPLKIINTKNDLEKINIILDLLIIHKASGIVIGLPISMDGSENENSTKIRMFAQNLANKTDLPIFMQDERLSTSGANKLLQSYGFKRKDRNQMDDAVAASLILETTLNTIMRL